MITVANVKTCNDGIYIGRAMPGRNGSPLGNPYKLAPGASREQVITQYRAWLDEQIKNDTPASKELSRLIELAKTQDIVLLCWCAPQACHGDVIKEYIEFALEVDEALIEN